MAINAPNAQFQNQSSLYSSPLIVQNWRIGLARVQPRKVQNQRTEIQDLAVICSIHLDETTDMMGTEKRKD